MERGASSDVSGRSAGAQWVIWEDSGDETVFDLRLNVPVYLSSPAVTREVIRLLRDSGAPTFTDYPGRPCHARA